MLCRFMADERFVCQHFFTSHEIDRSNDVAIGYLDIRRRLDLAHRICDPCGDASPADRCLAFVADDRLVVSLHRAADLFAVR